jgi:hypothetical protein
MVENLLPVRNKMGKKPCANGKWHIRSEEHDNKCVTQFLDVK